MRAAAASFVAAALFGVLRFTALYPETFPHQFLSMLSGVAGFPALAFAAARPASRLTRAPLPAGALVIALGAAGTAIVVGLGWRPYMDACALLSVVALFWTMRRRSDTLGGGAALAMLVGLLCFAAKFPANGPLAPGDLLHLGLASGWILLARSHR